MNFSEWSQCLGSVRLSAWQIHGEGEGREGKEGRSESCFLVISWVPSLGQVSLFCLRHSGWRPPEGMLADIQQGLLESSEPQAGGGSG